MKMCLEVQFMNLYIEARVLDIADYIVETGATVRAALQKTALKICACT